jgi:hypothetical protein
MTDELTDKLRALVADPPPPTSVPSEAVLERVQMVRRRRAAGAAALASVAVVAIAVTANNLAGVNSAPPVTQTPSQSETIVTSPPTASPPPATDPTPSATKTSDSVQTPQPTNTPETAPTSDPSPTSEPPPTTTTPPVAPKLNLNVQLEPSYDNLTVTMKVSESGTVLEPTLEEGGTLQADRFQDNLLFVKFWWGDGASEEWDRYGGISCYNAKRPISGTGTNQLGQPHTYAKPGAYTFTYQVNYCTPNQSWGSTVTRTVRLTMPTVSN